VKKDRIRGNIIVAGGVCISMDPNRLRMAMAPVLASVFLILSLCSVVARRQSSTGIPFHLYPLHPETNLSGVCNSRAIVLWLTRDGRIWINDTEVAPATLRKKLGEIFENRTVQRAYVVTDSEASYYEFANYMSSISGATPRLDVVLLSGQLRREVEHEPTFEGVCDISSPESNNPWIKPFVHYLR
jgi:biopolymer transport protein ExbD